MSQVNHHVSGAAYWRSLEQLGDSPAVRELVAQEFPGYDADGMTASSRRGFLKIMGAAMALAGLTLSGCRRWPEERLAPFSSNPAGRIPGIPEQYATAYEIGGVAQGLLVTSFDGRPIKIEGNPTHPMANLGNQRYGASTMYSQASLLDMYDPQRSRGVTQRTGNAVKNSTWDAFAEAFTAAGKRNPGGVAVLSEATASPSVLEMKQRFSEAYPQAKWYEYEAASRDNELEGARMAFGQALRPYLHLDKAEVVLCLDADPLCEHPANLRYSADWAARRRSVDAGSMNRVYSIESTFSNTGSVADIRIGAAPERVYAVARAIAAGLGVSGLGGENLSKQEQEFVTAVVADLKQAGKSAVVTAGPTMAPAVHALAHAINGKLGGEGTTFDLLADPAGDRPTHIKAISELAGRMKNGQVQTLLIIGGNPAFDAPADLEFAAALAKLNFSAHLSLYEDETSRLCKWHLPRAHYLEAWGDARSWDGTATLAQPLIEPLFGGKSAIEVLALLTEDEKKDGESIIRRTWSKQLGSDLAWRKSLEQGVIPNSAFKAQRATLKTVNFPAVENRPAGTFAVRLSPDWKVYDGRFANNGWLQETPEPLTKLVWDNAALINVRDAKEMGIEQGDMIRIEAGNGHTLEVAAFLMPGQGSGVLAVSYGYGRTAAGPIGDNLGFNTYAIRTTTNPDVIPAAKVSKVGKVYTLATTQEHHILENIADWGEEERIGKRGHSGKIVKDMSLAEYKADPKQLRRGVTVPLQIFEPPMQFTDTHAWGMSIDTNSCTGCGACLLACQAENNIPIVGKTEVLRHREMNWIRVDRYFKGDAESDNVDIVHQIMMCQHCENAPCEQVCPVAATMHDSEGLNVMVYNRCIGTRYCSNNCPYKVRRFNYFDFHAKNPREKWGRPWPGMPDEQQDAEVSKIKRMVYNPEVTVRMRGVMEKCTYCVQRIHGATISKRAAGGDVKDFDIITACQQACPTQAIVFGNLKDPQSKVSELHRSDRQYEVLDDLNTRTRTRYLAKVRNRAQETESQA